MTSAQNDHGFRALELLDQAKTELILIQAGGDYVNLSSVKTKLKCVIAEVEDIMFPVNNDIEAAVLRDGGTDIRIMEE